MRLSTVVIAALVVALPEVSGRVINELLGRDATTTDVCANIDAGLAIDILGISIVVGLIDICLCISGIPAILTANAVVEAAVSLGGEAAVVAELTTMINTASGHQTCTYPEHFEPACVASNPCGFQCKDGFTPSPAKKPVECICVPPKIVCNGICGDFKSCPSSHPKRELEIEKRNAMCDRGYTPCGVFGWNGMRASQSWECVDTQSDLESCGGCVVPLAYGSPHGIDCTAIPGVADVSCGAGSCIVHRCLPGYTPSLDRSFCIRKSDLQFEFGSEIPAAAYALEHFPFNKKAN